MPLNPDLIGDLLKLLGVEGAPKAVPKAALSKAAPPIPKPPPGVMVNPPEPRTPVEGLGAGDEDFERIRPAGPPSGGPGPLKLTVTPTLPPAGPAPALPAPMAGPNLSPPVPPQFAAKPPKQYSMDLPGPTPVTPNPNEPPGFSALEPQAPPNRIQRELDWGNKRFRKEFNLDVYHGTSEPIKFDEFRLPSMEMGVHLGTQKAAHDIKSLPYPHKVETQYEPREGSRIYPLKARIKNPLEMGDLGTWSLNKMKDGLKETGKFKPEEIDTFGKAGLPGLRALLESKGYDGIKYVNRVEHRGSISYMVWDPAQLRAPWAEFDPQKAQSRNLMAGVAGAAAVPAASMLGSERAEAAPIPNAKMLLETLRGNAKEFPVLLDALKAADESHVLSVAKEFMGKTFTSAKKAISAMEDRYQRLNPEAMVEKAKSIGGRTAGALIGGAAGGAVGLIGGERAEAAEGVPPPPPGVTIDSPAANQRGAVPAPPPGVTVDVPRETPEESPKHRHYLGRVLDIPKDFMDVFREHRESLGAAGSDADIASMPLVERMMTVLGATGDLMGAAFSPALGIKRAMVDRPFAEHFISRDSQEAREEYVAREAAQRAAAGQSPATDEPIPEGLEGTESKTKRLGGVTDFFVPGYGLINYSKLGKVIRTSKAGSLIEKTLSPTSVDSDAAVAEDLLRGAGGRAARDEATARAAMDVHQKVVNQLNDIQKLDFISHVEAGPAGIANLPTPLRDLANTMRDAFALRLAKLQSLPKHAQMEFVDDYFPHMWKDPQTAGTFATNFASGPGKQGSGASLKKRTVPTVYDGIAAGLEPITTNPIEMATRYVASMDRFIAAESVREVADLVGNIRYIKPQVMGASGHPSSFKVPPGWAPLNGRGATNATGAKAYAPEGFARVYNNFISKGFFANTEAGTAYDIAMKATNAVKTMELGLSGYHAITMAREAAISRLATGLQEVGGGAAALDALRILRGTGKVATAPIGPFKQYLQGRQLERVYLGQTPGSPNYAQVTDLLEKAGGRAKGSAHARDYQYSAQGSYVRAWRQGALKFQLAADAAEMAKQPLAGTAKVTVRHIGRIMATGSEWLFNHTIPRLKNGAFYETMHAWLQANPAASHSRQVAQARVIWDSIDNRFGEMVNDNIFWHNSLKQGAQLGLLSYSWNLGTIREIGGGVKDIAKPIADSTRKAYVVALPMYVAAESAVLGYLLTGKGPDSLLDLLAPQTGGTQTMSIPSTRPFGRSSISESPERLLLPGYQKDVFGWLEDPLQEATNKVSPAARMFMEVMTNKDWQGSPIVDPEGKAPEWLKAYLKYAVEGFTPISFKSKTQLGSQITRPEQLMGMRPAPAYISNPEGYDRLQHALNKRAQDRKKALERSHERRYGGPE